jgi:hypothetical protein
MYILVAVLGTALARPALLAFNRPVVNGRGPQPVQSC